MIGFFALVVLVGFAAVMLPLIVAVAALKLVFRLILFPVKILLLPLILIAVIVKFAVLLAIGAVIAAVLIPVAILVAIFAIPFVIASAAAA
jgi:hypothetical protein